MTKLKSDPDTKRILRMPHESNTNDQYPDQLHWNWMLNNYDNHYLPSSAKQRAAERGWAMSLQELKEKVV